MGKFHCKDSDDNQHIFNNSIFLIKVYNFFRHNAIACLTNCMYSVNITFICTGKPKNQVTRFIAIFTLPQ